MTKGLLLSSDVYFSYYFDDIVLLRLGGNRYSQIRSKEAALLHRLAQAASTGDAPISATGVVDDGAAKRLLDLGVLTLDPAAGRPVAPTVAALPVEHLVDVISRRKPRIRTAHFAAFLWAAAAATSDLARASLPGRSLAGAVRRIQARNARLREAALDGEEAHDLVVIFNELRLFWPRKYLCRFDSLALVHFLACFGLRAQWVFGVRLDPFGAHCWVQDERRLYNDDIELITQYQPIMVVS